MLTSFSKIVCAMALLPVCVGTVRAEAPLSVRLEDLTVQARPVSAGDHIGQAGDRITRIEPQQRHSLNAHDLSTSLRRIPGVTVSRYNTLGAFGGADGGSIYLRGLGTARPGGEIRLYTDGIPREVGVWGHPLIDTTPVDFAERIDIRKGPAPAAYPGTFGSVEITGMRHHTPGSGGFLDVATGENNTRIGTVGFGARTGDTDVFGGMAHKTSDGHRPHAAARLQSQYARIGHQPVEELELSWIFHHTDNQTEDPGRAGTPAPQRERFDSRTLTQILRLDLQTEPVTGFLAGYYEDGAIRWARDRIGGPGSPPGSTDTDWENFGLRSGAELRRGDLILHPVFDVEWQGGSFRNRTLGGATPFAFDDRYRTLTPGLFLRFEPDIGDARLTTSVGARYLDHNRFRNEWAPHLGARLVRQEWTFGALYSRGVHFPGVYAAGVSASTVERLKAETLHHWEASADWHPSSRLQVTGTLFRDEGDNRILTTADGMVNAGAFEHSGAELSLSVSPSDFITLFLGGAWLHAHRADSPRTPEFTVSAGVITRLPGGFELSVDAERVDRQTVLNPRQVDPGMDTETIDGFLLLNARLGYVLPPLWGHTTSEIYLAVENLGDRQYEYFPGYPMPGRTVMGGLRLQF